ncbi:MAG: hypothetical protein WAV21_00290 [Minisyncoccia bacterium]
MGIESGKNSDKKMSFDIGTAIMKIKALEHQVRVTGAVDQEPEAFAHIEAEVISGRLTPEQGVEKAETLVAGRQDYH